MLHLDKKITGESRVFRMEGTSSKLCNNNDNNNNNTNKEREDGGEMGCILQLTAG